MSMMINAKYLWHNVKCAAPEEARKAENMVMQVVSALAPAVGKLAKLSAQVDFMEMAASLTDAFQGAVEEPETKPEVTPDPPRVGRKKA